MANPNADAEQMLHAALRYTEQYGWALFPCRANSKQPATQNGVLNATTNRDMIRRWWQRYPDHNIAIACGPISGGLVAVDIDGDAGETTMRQLEEQCGVLPCSIQSITPNGRHVLLQGPADAEIRNSVGQLGSGIDIRADGGYIVCPPSRHPCGALYHWHVDNTDKPAPIPGWLLNRIQAPRRGSASVTNWAALIHNDINDGERNDTLARIVGHLMRRSVAPQVALEIAAAINDARCRPPLLLSDITIIINSIAARERRKRTGWSP